MDNKILLRQYLESSKIYRDFLWSLSGDVLKYEDIKCINHLRNRFLEKRKEWWTQVHGVPYTER